MCPPGVDQTTRSRERWTLLAPVLEEQYDITNDLSNGGNNYSNCYGFDRTKFVKHEFTWDAFDKLARYERDGQKALSILSALPDHSQATASSPIESLPTEIVKMILSSPCLESEDIISLGMSSQVLWVHILDHIIQKHRQGPWAGTPLLCTGTWTMSMPPSIHALKPDMKQEEHSYFALPSLFHATGTLRNFVHGRGLCPARSFNWGAISSYSEREKQDRCSVWAQCFNDLCKTSSIPTRPLKVLRRSLEAVVGFYKSSLPTAWTLRNQTTKEYVSLKTDRSYGKDEYYLHVKGVPWLSLDKAVLLRIMWSASYKYDNEDDDEDVEADSAHTRDERLLKYLKRGKWAGHCFDVVPADKHFLCNEDAESWCDVTHELVKEAKVWKSVLM